MGSCGSKEGVVEKQVATIEKENKAGPEVTTKSIMKQNSLYEVVDDNGADVSKKSPEMVITWKDGSQGNVQIEIEVPGWNHSDGQKGRRISRSDKLRSRKLPMSMRINVSTTDADVLEENFENEPNSERRGSNRRLSHIERLKQRKLKGVNTNLGEVQEEIEEK